MAAAADLAVAVHQEDGKMGFINDSEKQKISDAIRDAEQNTSGELVTVITPASDDYYYIPTLWGAVLALIIPIIIHLSGGISSVEILMIMQMVTFLLLSLLFRYPPLKYRLIPKSVKYARAARFAREQFFAQGLHNTKDRTGVMIFVSVAEHYVEILADKGINDKVDAQYWQVSVEAFIADMKAGKIADGFLRIIKSCGHVLAEQFPVKANDKNELPNHLIEL